MSNHFSEVIARVWQATGSGAGPQGEVGATGPRVVLPSVFDVTGLATGAVAAATAAAAELLAARGGGPVPGLTVDSTAACAAFRAEALFAPHGWTLPPVWDPLAGNYRTADGWVRLHTNYAYHRAAVERLLGSADRDGVQAAVSTWKAADLESAVVEAGGAASALHSRQEWLASPAGAAAAREGSLVAGRRPAVSPRGGSAWSTVPELPFEGVRVLDLTRVIAGPMCTKFLAAYGADVLRIDPPGFEEVGALLPETTLGKRTAALDLTAADGRSAFERLVAGADVLVSGLRSDALDRLGYDDEALARLNPDLIVASLDAYGWSGPWRTRRGFDSLVQLSCGIAADGAAASGTDQPVALPAQALDHATGWLLAAAVARALTARITRSEVRRLRTSLAATAELLYALPPSSEPAQDGTGSLPLEPTDTFWGPALRVPLPGVIPGVVPRWRHPAGPLGAHSPTWS
jgi:hypothetical protein